jgi:integrase
MTAIPRFAGLDRLPSGRIRARYRDSTGKQHSRIFASREIKKAQAWRLGQMAKVHDGTHVIDSKITLAAYARQVQASRPHRLTTARLYESRLRNHLENDRLGARPISLVRESEIQHWVTERSQSLAVSTTRELYSWLRSIFASALSDKLIRESPFSRRIKLPTPTRAIYVPLSVVQVQALATAMPDRYRAAVVAQSGLGLRLSELLALQVPDVSFLSKNPSVTIARQLLLRDRSYGPLKTPASARVIPLPDVVHAALSAHLRDFSSNRDDQLIFTTTDGLPISHTWFSNLLKRAVKVAGLPPQTSSHDLRHFLRERPRRRWRRCLHRLPLAWSPGPVACHQALRSHAS